MNESTVESDPCALNGHCVQVGALMADTLTPAQLDELWTYSPDQWHPDAQVALHHLIFPSRFTEDGEEEPLAFTGLAWCSIDGYYGGCYGFQHWVPFYAFIPLCNVHGDPNGDAARLVMASGDIDVAEGGWTFLWNETGWRFVRSIADDEGPLNFFLGPADQKNRRALLMVWSTADRIWLGLLHEDYNREHAAGRVAQAVERFRVALREADSEEAEDYQWFFWEPMKYSSDVAELYYMGLGSGESYLEEEEPYAEEDYASEGWGNI